MKGSNKESVFDIKGIGGMVVAPGSIHPDTGKPYVVLDDRPIAKAPKWLLDLALKQVIPIEEERPKHIELRAGNLESLHTTSSTKELIKTGRKKGERSEAIWKVINTLVMAEESDDTILAIFDKYQIGEKYREKGRSKTKWLKQQIRKARAEQTIGNSKSLTRETIDRRKVCFASLMM